MVSFEDEQSEVILEETLNGSSWPVAMSEENGCLDC